MITLKYLSTTINSLNISSIKLYTKLIYVALRKYSVISFIQT